MTATLTPAPVRRTLHVPASPARAFAVFTDGFARWWPRSHSVGRAPMASVTIEPHAGGRWFETGEDGAVCDWGKVLVWDPPGRLVLAWQLDARWTFDPGLVTEVEVRFLPDGEGTRVEFEHRNLDRFGAGTDAVRAAFEGPKGWGAILEGYAAAAGADDGALRSAARPSP